MDERTLKINAVIAEMDALGKGGLYRGPLRKLDHYVVTHDLPDDVVAAICEELPATGTRDPWRIVANCMELGQRARARLRPPAAADGPRALELAAWAR